MTIRSILTIFNGTDREMPMLETAFALAVKYDAQLRCLHVSPEPHAYPGIYGEGMIMSAEIIAAVERENRQQLERAKQHFEALAIHHRIAVQAEMDAPPLHHAYACFMHRTGMMEEIAAEEGRISDLILLHRSPTGDTGMAYEGALSATLFETARPLLLVPGSPLDLSLDHTVAFAWNNSREAAHALAGALPFMRQAETVHLLVARHPKQAFDLGAEPRILAYLRQHGIAPQFHVVDRKGDEPGDVLLGKARSLKAGLLVMGAYGHSRLREMALGGVTEYMLCHADMPLLMAH